MCGLYGSITKKDSRLTKTQKEYRARVLRGLAIAMQSRGTDSTGLAVARDNRYLMYKRAVSAREFLADKNTDKLLKYDFTTAIGHTRFATIGAINDDNAHPFLKGSIIGAHNGSVNNHADFKAGEVDSEVIFHLLNESKNDYKKSFKQLRGNFAVSWIYFGEPNTAFLAVEDNPLSIVRVRELDTIFWCSEQLPLETVIESVLGLGKKDVFEADKDTLYKITPELEVKKHGIEFGQYKFVTSWNDDKDKTIKDVIIEGKTGSTEDDFEIKDYDRYSATDSDEDLYYSLLYPYCKYCNKKIDPHKGMYVDYESYDVWCTPCGNKLEDPDLEWLNFSDYNTEMYELESVRLGYE